MHCATPCKNCDRKGLPILFTRYAAAYTSQVEGMAALKQLQPTGQLQAKPGGVTMATALYNVRMLRPGYLYVRIKRAGLSREWTGYAVHPHGYLSEFAVACPQEAKANPACEVEIRGANATMVWVTDAKRVESLHYLFHPDPLDYEHLIKEIEPNLLRYAQSFDAAGWAGGSTSQKDTCQPGQLNGQVMEFSALYAQTVLKVGNEQHYGLMGTTGAEREWGDYSEARFGRHFENVRHEAKNQADVNHNGVTDTGASGGLAIGPYVVEVLGARYGDKHGPRLRKIASSLGEQKGAVVACEDAIGIAQELSLHHLSAALPYVAWLKQVTGAGSVTNQWKQAASESIKTIEGALYKRAMQMYDDETDRLERVGEVMSRRHPTPVGKILVPRADGGYSEVDVKEVEAKRKEELKQRIESRKSDRHLVSDVQSTSALAKTRAHYDPVERKKFDDAHLEKIVERNSTMDRITEDLLKWIESETFFVKTLGRYNRAPSDIDSGDGARCAVQLCAIL